MDSSYPLLLLLNEQYWVVTEQCWVVRVTFVMRYCNALLFGVTSQVTCYYLPEVTL